MKTKRRVIKATVILLTAALLLVLSGYTGIGYEVYSRLWPGPKTGCSVTLTVDGEPFRLSRDDVKGLMMNDGSENKVSFFRSTDTGCRFRCRGGVYGGQPFRISFQTKEMSEPAIIPVSIVVSDSWRTTDITLNISADTSSGRYTYDITVREGAEEYSYIGEAELYSGEEIRLSDI